MDEVGQRSVVHRAIAVAMLFLFLGASRATMLCVGWAGSATERMACCQRESSPCASLSPDDCCAAGEQRQNSEKLAIDLRAADMPLSDPASLVDFRPRARAADPRSLADRPATHLLDSVFRI